MVQSDMLVSGTLARPARRVRVYSESGCCEVEFEVGRMSLE